MNDPIFWLAAAGAVVWICVGGYAACLGLRQTALARRVQILERENDEDE